MSGSDDNPAPSNEEEMLGDALLRDRIWRLRENIRSDIDHVLTKAVEEGTDAEEVARALEQYMSPDELLPPADRQGIARRSPVGGGWAPFLTGLLAYQEIRRLADLENEPRGDSEREPRRRRTSPGPRNDDATGTRPPHRMMPTAPGRGQGSTTRVRALVRTSRDRAGQMRELGLTPSLTARCGNARHGCRGYLGIVENAEERKREDRYAYIDYPSDLMPESRWVLIHTSGFGGDAARGFHILGEGRRDKNGQRIGARRVPTNMYGIAPLADITGRQRGFAGQLPQLPCVVFCPICGAPNEVYGPLDDMTAL